MRFILRPALVFALVLFASGCVTSTVDEMVFNEPVEGIGDSTVVILGRRHASDYETEPDFIDCVGKHISSRDRSIEVIGELDFLNALYPWFEPRTAPLSPQDIDKLMAHPPVAARMAELKTEYMIWVDGNTIRTEGAGSMTCGIGPGGAGCFGFGTWGNEADYEATIWDVQEGQSLGIISSEASGTSVVPALGVPIPMIARTKSASCKSMADQLRNALTGSS